MEARDPVDLALFSAAIKAYKHQNGPADVPSKETSSQEGNVVVLRNANREVARYRLFERGGRPASGPGRPRRMPLVVRETAG